MLVSFFITSNSNVRRQIRAPDRSLAGDITALKEVTYFILRSLANTLINFMKQAIKGIQASVVTQSSNQVVR